MAPGRPSDTDDAPAQPTCFSSEARFRELAEMLPEIVFEVDSRGVLQYANHKAFELTGYDEGDVQRGLTALDLLIPEDRQRASEAMRRTLSGEPSMGNEYTALRKDGLRYPVLVRSAPIRRAGQVVGLRGVVLDIRQQKEVEEALRESEERMRSLLELSEEGIAVMDAEGHVTFRSPANARIVGYSDAEFTRGDVLALVHPDDYEMMSHMRQQLLQEGPADARCTVFRIRHKDGSWRWMEIAARNLTTDPRICGIVVNYRDVTEARAREAARRRAEEEKRRLEQELLHAQKLEAVGRLAGGVAHDFNNLLTAISGNVSLALMDIGAESPAHECLVEITRSTERAARLTRQLLTFSRRQPIQLSLVDLNQLVVDLATSIVARLIGEDIEIDTELAQPGGVVLADPGQIEQVLVNLVINARDAMPGGGTLRLKTGTASVVPQQVHLSGEAPSGGPYVTLAVTDNGCGMDEATRRRAFEPFFTTKPKDRGTGLGLSTAYGILQQHGGAIRLESRPHGGCTARIYLPRADAVDVTDPRESTADDVALARGRETILLVEDESAVNRVASSLLRSLGYRIHRARDAEEALSLAKRYGAEIDLLLTDVVLPGLNGRQLAERLSYSLPALKVLYASGYSEDVIEHHGVVESGINFIAKPYSLAALAKKVRQVLDD